MSRVAASAATNLDALRRRAERLGGVSGGSGEELQGVCTGGDLFHAEVNFRVFEQHQGFEHVAHIVRQVAQERLTLIPVGFFGEANKDTDKCGAEVVKQGEVDDKVPGTRLAEQAISFIVCVANIVITKFHEWPMCGEQEHIALEFEAEDLLVVT